MGAYAVGEVDEGREVRAGLHGEGVGRVEDVGRFVVDGSAGLDQTRFAVLGVVVDGAVRCGVDVMAAVQLPFAAMVHDSGLVRGVLEMDDFIAEYVDVNHAADFIWEFCKEHTAATLWPAAAAAAWSRQVSVFLRSFGERFGDCGFVVPFPSVQCDGSRD